MTDKRCDMPGYPVIKRRRWVIKVRERGAGVEANERELRIWDIVQAEKAGKAFDLRMGV
jgi:hypothetical protein